MAPKVRQPAPPPNSDKYLALDGTTTSERTRAAKFFSADSALEFARSKGVAVDGVMQYPYQVDFDERDLQHG